MAVEELILIPAPAAPAPTSGSEARCCPPGPGLMAKPDAEALAEMFRAVADPVRVRLLKHIADAEHGTACACHLPDALGIAQPTLSHHLKKLTDAGLISREQRGRWAHYSIQPAVIEQLQDFLHLTRRRDAATQRSEVGEVF